MKKYTRRNTLISIMSALPFLLFSLGLCAETTLPEKDRKILEQAGVPLYPGIQFTNGALGGVVGVRFASSDDVEKVRKWYIDKLPDWAVNDQYGSWIYITESPVPD